MSTLAIWLLAFSPGAIRFSQQSADLGATPQAAESRTDWGLAESTRQMLIQRCGDCHTPESTDRKAVRALSDVGDMQMLVEDFVLAGNLDLSDIYTVIVDGDMPPPKSDVAPPSPQEMELLKAWIMTGAEVPVAPTSDLAVEPGPDPSPWKLYVARSHPIWIHFPLGVIPIAFLAALLSFWKRASGMETTARFCALVAFPTAIAAALSGWLHASEGVDTFEVDLHRWTGVATAVLCGAALVVRNRPRLFVSTLALASALVAAAGHFGGRLTYGADFFPW